MQLCSQAGFSRGNARGKECSVFPTFSICSRCGLEQREGECWRAISRAEDRRIGGLCVECMKERPWPDVFRPMKESVAKLNQWASTKCNIFLSRTGGVIRSAFGQVSWNPPGWAEPRSRTLARFLKRPAEAGRLLDPGRISLACAGGEAGITTRTCPQPHRVTASISPIPVTSLEKDLKFPALRITFSESAAQLEDLKKKSLGDGVGLDPSLPGTLALGRRQTSDLSAFGRLAGGDQIPGQFRAHIFSRSHVIMERLAYDVQTPAVQHRYQRPETLPGS